MLRPREATLTFPAPGTSLGTLEHLGVTFADGELLDDAVDDSARAARAAFGAHAPPPPRRAPRGVGPAPPGPRGGPAPRGRARRHRLPQRLRRPLDLGAG